MSSLSTGASTSTWAGSESGSAAACRATWIPPCCWALSRVSWRGLAASCDRRAAGRATFSTSATACCRAARSRICRRWSRPCARVSRSMFESPKVRHAPLPGPLPEGERGRTAVLCMAYGSPRGEDGVEPYYTHIRGGRPPSPEALVELNERYRAIGGSPLTAITQAQARALSDRLELPVFAGMKHAPPFIADAAAQARAAGITRLVGLPLAHARVKRALVCPIGFVADHLEILYDIDVEAMSFAHEHGIELRRTASFNARPEFIDALAAVVRDALKSGSQVRARA